MKLENKILKLKKKMLKALAKDKPKKHKKLRMKLIKLWLKKNATN